MKEDTKELIEVVIIFFVAAMICCAAGYYDAKSSIKIKCLEMNLGKEICNEILK
jgi:hypothetical protein